MPKVFYDPDWGKAVKKALIDVDMTITDLADRLELSRTHVSAVINGRENSPSVSTAISNFLGIEQAS